MKKVEDSSRDKQGSRKPSGRMTLNFGGSGMFNNLKIEHSFITKSDFIFKIQIKK